MTGRNRRRQRRRHNHGVRIQLLPVLRNHPSLLPQQEGRQMWHPYPRQNQESRVTRHLLKIAFPRRNAPTDVLITTSDLPRRSPPANARKWPLPQKRDVPEVLSDDLPVAEVVVLVHKITKQHLILCPTHHPNFDGTQLTQLLPNRPWCKRQLQRSSNSRQAMSFRFPFASNQHHSRQSSRETRNSLVSSAG